ncbi:transposase [Fusibacter sp. 3D3]|uniref:transposase n=1 Tax=Fusibacter sp. 3D3 TaxID=1048380 RepID=UPI00158605C1
MSTFSNIELVSRDGSTSYRSAINESHPDAIQISDRFHLVKAISKYMKRIING